MSIEIPAWIDGILTPVEKLDAHRRDLRHKAVSVFLCRGDSILLQRRALSKYHTPGLWANTCCTHPDWNEEALACARRRLREELGITDVAPEFRSRIEYRAEVGNGLVEHEVVDVFVADAPPGLRVAPNPDEVMDVAWRDLTELQADIRRHPDRYTPWLKIYLSKHAGAILGTMSGAVV